MPIETSINAGIAEITIKLPPVNAVTGKDQTDIGEIVTEAGTNQDVQCVILTAEGRGFCAGIDIKALAEDPSLISEFNRGAHKCFRQIHHCPVPVIAAVHGYALGSGMAMVGASDIVIAAEGTKFGLPEVNVGMLGGASHLLRMLPIQKVRKMYFTGEPMLAEKMLELGAIESVVPENELLSAARNLAEKIASKDNTTLRFAKEALNAIEPVDLEKNYRYEQGYTFEISHLSEGQKARKEFRKS